MAVQLAAQLAEMQGWEVGLTKEGSIVIELPIEGEVVFPLEKSAQVYEFDEYTKDVDVSDDESRERLHYFLGGTEATLNRSVEPGDDHGIHAVEQREAWDVAYINRLPDSAFFYIESGGEKDEEGKTTPRSLRHLPYVDEKGEVDLPHVRNALARAAQTQDKNGNKLAQGIIDRITAKAKRILDREEKSCGIMELPFLQELKELFGHKKEVVMESPFFYTIRDGKRYRWMTLSSTAFVDRVNEIVSQAALTKEVARASTGDLGPLLFWHNPNIVLGQCDFRTLDGLVLIESGLWDDTAVATAVRKALAKDCSGWGTSIGFLANTRTAEKEVSVNGRVVKCVWNDIFISERSLLPIERAANPFTAIMAEGEKDMDEAKKAALAQLVGTKMAETIAAQVDTTNASKEQPDAVYKETSPLQELAAIVKDTDALASAIVQELSKEGLPDATRESMFALLKMRLPQDTASQELVQRAVGKPFPPKEDAAVEDEEDDKKKKPVESADKAKETPQPVPQETRDADTVLSNFIKAMTDKLDTIEKNVQALQQQDMARILMRPSTSPDNVTKDAPKAGTNQALAEITGALLSKMGGS